MAKEISDYFLNLTLSNNYDNELSETILNEFTNLLKSTEMSDYFVEVLDKCVQLIKSQKNFIKSMKVIRRSVTSVSNSVIEVTRNKFYHILVEKNPTITLIMNNLNEYHSIASKIIQDKKIETNSIDNYCFTSEFSDFSITHKDFMIEYFSFINFITTYHKVTTLSQEHVKSLFIIFVERPISESDTNSFFKWLKDAEEKKGIPDGSNQEMFKILTNSK